MHKKIIYQRPADAAKLIHATEIPIRHPFDYLKFHNEERTRIFGDVTTGKDVKKTISPTETGQLVKKVLYGALFPPAIKTLMQTRTISIRKEVLTYERFMDRFSKVVLATDLPGYEPILYLRPRREREYYKMVQDRSGNFRFERATPSTVGFFLWLESIKPTLGSKLTFQFLDAFKPEPVKPEVNSRKSKK
jgi:hypothetical protein